MAKDIFVVVLRAGHLQAAPDYRIERRVCAGHDLLLCIQGSGWISIKGRAFRVAPRQLAWLDGHHPHAHWAEPRHPWELLWARVDGHFVDRIAGVLEILRYPVFALSTPARVERALRRVLRLMRSRPRTVEVLLHADITFLLATLFEARLSERAELLKGRFEVPTNLQKAIDDLSLYYYRQWRVRDLAQDAGMSVPHFFRCFQNLTGLTPVAYLRRERINHAKRRLLESADEIKEIAEQVGYLDQFYFSRDFKRYTGHSPSEYRRLELGLASKGKQKTRRK